MKRLFFDIETSPNIVLSWRAGFKINISHDSILQERAIICACWKWEGQKKVHSISWEKGKDDNVVAKVLEVMHEADEIVAHNGDRFDVPWINTRALMLGFQPVPEWKTVDTLKIAKKHFYFNSNRLDYIASILLGSKKDKTEFDMWKDILLNNCPKAMARMVKYCKKDVALLEKVYEKLRPYARVKSHVGVLENGMKWTSPFTGTENVTKSKTVITAKGTKQHQMKCGDTGGYFTISDLAYKQYREWRDA